MAIAVLRKERQGWLMSSPYLLYTAVFFVIPLLWSIFLIFLKWDLISPTREFVGLANLREALTSSRVWNALLVSYKFMALFLPTVMVASIGLALIVHHLPRFKPIFAVGFFLPYLASGVAVSIVVRGVLSYTSPVNTFLRATFGASPNWLGDPTLAVLVISVMIA